MSGAIPTAVAAAADDDDDDGVKRYRCSNSNNKYGSRDVIMMTELK